MMHNNDEIEYFFYLSSMIFLVTCHVNEGNIYLQQIYHHLHLCHIHFLEI